ncbi:MAG: ABC transporter permease subunit [Thermoguttaceae bacterium]|nr:ABC transporter permease subunit [Thermoguttaceae bacterium]MDW8037795.1 ABC transporter permease subunit/CPBP intramembrane protease [Thermoguttaceae bacterium]
MNWQHVWLVFCRELRDQFRDRRTLFMMVVLPLVLYPLLGMSLFQIRQFLQEKAIRVLVLGIEHLQGVEPALVEGGQFAAGLFDDPQRAALVELVDARQVAGFEGAFSWAQKREQAKLAVQAGMYDAALYIPPDFAQRLAAVREAMKARSEQTKHSGQPASSAEQPLNQSPLLLSAEPIASDSSRFGKGVGQEILVPKPEIFYSTATERSQLAYARLMEVVERWREAIAARNLEASGMPVQAARPFDLQKADVAEQTAFRGAAVWAKILPVMLLLWALTGAFYPAIDLCAGEKERGTLETLLCSPVDREDIVVGKLLTVMLFSMMTALLNVGAIGLTGWLLLAQLPGVGAPPIWSAVWLLMALVPMSALFGALCLALSALARSSKEAQYYLMPLLVISMPLAIWPMAPGVELSLGTSLIPVSGVVLVLRAAMEGNGWQALEFLPPVVAVTLGCCAVAVRWAVEQFNSEKVLFRSAERLELGLWLRHLVRDRPPSPTAGAALACAVGILLLKFFLTVGMSNLDNLVFNVLVSQLAVVLAPALFFGLLLARSPRQSFLLRWPHSGWKGLVPLGAAALLAVVSHPTAMLVQAIIIHLYPIDPAVLRALKQMESTLCTDLPFWQVLGLMALLPAVCEELAFRGFILSGFLRTGRPARAIFYTALFFGLTHPVLQQAIAACAVGMLLGFLAFRTGSILPSMVFHFTYNALWLSLAVWSGQETVESAGIYPWPIVVGSIFLSTIGLIWFWKWSAPCQAMSSGVLEKAKPFVFPEPLEAVSADMAPAPTSTCIDSDPCLKPECKT